MKLKFSFNRALSRGALPPGDHRFWFFCRSVALRLNLGTENRWAFEIFYRRLILVLASFVVIGWIALSAGLFYWLNRTPHNQVAWLDLAAPWRWSTLKTKRGDTAILNGLADLKAKDFSKSFYGLRVGLARSPGNVEGRMTLVRMLRPANPLLALQTAEEGIAASGDNPEFLAGLLWLYNDLQIRAHALETIESLLKEPRVLQVEDSRALLARARAQTLFQMNRFEEAQAALADVAPKTPEQRASVHALHVELLVKMGRTAEARERAAAFNDSAALSLRQQADIAVALGDSDALQSVLRRLRAQSPDQPSVYLAAVQYWARLKRLTLREQAEQDYFMLFASNEGALQAISTLAVTLQLPEVITRAQEIARMNRVNGFAFRVHYTEAALRRGQIEEAIASLRAWEDKVDTVNATQRFYPEFVKRLTRAVFANTAEQTAQLVSTVSSNGNRVGLPSLIMATDVLEQSGNFSGASQVAQVALSVFPYHDGLLAAKQRLDEKLAVQTAAATAAAASERATTTVALTALPESDTEALRQIDDWLRREKLSEARDLLRSIRAQKPAWLAAGEGEISLREVELAFLVLDRISSRAAVRSYLAHERSEAGVLRLVALTGRLNERKRAAEALLLRDEILAAPTATEPVRAALQKLNLADDLGTLAATQAGALTAIDAAIHNRDWALGERWLKYLREKPPEWAAAASVAIRVREVKIRFGLDQRPVALTVFRDLVLKAGPSRDASFALVRELAQEGEGKPALVLAREAVRLLPGESPAADLLKEIEALSVVGP